MQDMLFLGAGLHELAIGAPRLSDIPRIADLVKRSAVNATMHQVRFPANEDVWRSLFATQSIVCAKTRDGRIAGLYATNQFSLVYDADELLPLRAAQSVLCNRFKLLDKNVSFGSLAVIDLPWHNSDLREHLLRDLLRMVGLRYRCLFTVVKKDSLSEMQTLPREGWRCFHEEDDACYMMLDVAKALRSLATHLVMRIPNRPVESSVRQNRA
jgi:hypothetical protein